MTQLEKDQRQAALRASIADFQTKLEMLEDEKRALEAIPVKQEFKVWGPECREEYWNSGNVQDTFKANSDDESVIEAGLAHPTKEAAERHHEFLKMLRELEKFAVGHNEGWKPDFNNDNSTKWYIRIVELGVLAPDYWNTYNVTILPYFKTRELAQKAIDTFGGRLKILFEYYNS